MRRNWPQPPAPPGQKPAPIKLPSHLKSPMKKWLALFFSLTALIADVTHAESIMTLEQVLASALANHPAIMSKRSQEVAARADKKGAEWARFPTPSIEASTEGTGSGDNIGLFRIDQPLWTGGRISAGIDAADSRLDAAGAALDETRLDMTLQVIDAYAQALQVKERREYAESSVEEHEKLLAMIQRRVGQKVSSLTDQRLAESRLLLVKNDLLFVNQAFTNLLTRLEQLSGETVTDVIWEGIDQQGVPVSLEQAKRDALAVSPTLRRLNHEDSASAADIKSRRAAFFPTTALRFEQGVGSGYSDSRAMLVLQATPGAGFSAKSNVESAVARREAIRQAREAADREVRERVAIDWNEWTNAILRFQAAESSSQISLEVFESYTRQYVIGRKTWIDVLNAVRETMSARFTLADARAQIAAAGLRLKAQTRNLEADD